MLEDIINKKYSGVELEQMQNKVLTYFIITDDNYIKIGSQANLYNRIGNSVCIPMVRQVMRSILEEFDFMR